MPAEQLGELSLAATRLTYRTTSGETAARGAPATTAPPHVPAHVALDKKVTERSGMTMGCSEVGCVREVRGEGLGKRLCGCGSEDTVCEDVGECVRMWVSVAVGVGGCECAPFSLCVCMD